MWLKEYLWRMRDDVHANGGARARPVIGDHRLAPQRRELVGD